MTSHRNLTPEERDAIDERIDHFFGFVRDVLNEPSVLDTLPHSAAIALTPIVDKDPGKNYLGETQHFAVAQAEDRERKKQHFTVNSRKTSA